MNQFRIPAALLGLALLLASAILFLGGTAHAQDGEGDDPAPTEAPSVDHSVFPMLAGPFESPHDVTAACLLCHPNAAAEVQATVHWTWEWENTVTGQTVGKRNVVNNYCVSLETNEPRCTSCHTGYGWRDDGFDFDAPTNVDCLVCHDTTGTYEKFPTAAGYPVSEPTESEGRTWEPPDLAFVAQHIGPTSRETCGSCHFYGGGGAAVKHGDLDPTLIDPSHALDVHMASDGLNFTCTECHTTEAHQIDGSRYDVPVSAGDIDGLTTCDSCHVEMQHGGAFGSMINTHMARVACESCHIPTFAREMPTKMWWDWSLAGQKNEEGKPYTVKNEAGDVIYDSKKGEFTWEQNVVPEYLWFNGTVTYTLPDTPIDPSGEVAINILEGSRDDPAARLWPVKAFRGIQPYDAGHDVIGVVHLFPRDAEDTAAYWKGWDWDQAFDAAMEVFGMPYSGEYGFVETVMVWPIAHMVAPAEHALDCADCHVSGGRIDWAALGYDQYTVENLLTFMGEQAAQQAAQESSE